MTLELSEDLVNSYRKEIEEDPLVQLAINACWKHDPHEICVRRHKVADTNHIFTNKVEIEGKPVTNQKSSGRCWIFACLNVIRLPFMKQFNIEEFEFSQAHLYFWDKIERSNYFLNKMVECAKKGEEVEGRLVSFLLEDPTCDGGQWDMLVNLITRHGLMPKKAFPESFSAENSLRMNKILKSKLREYTKEIRSLMDKEPCDEDIAELLKRQVREVFRIVSVCLGVPPEKITWEYYDKSKAYHKVGPLTSKEFYEQHVMPIFNVEDKVCLVTDPRPNNPYRKAYTVDCLGNTVGGRLTIYNNQPVDTLLELCTESIKNGEAVWFGCDISSRYDGKFGLGDLDMHDYKSLLGVDVNLTVSKADRLIYGDSAMTHAMTITAVTLDEDGKPQKWRVENSWGEDRGEKGYILMTSEWFREFVFEVVLDKKYVSQEIMSVFDLEPKSLPAWDPMGALAYC